MIRKIPSIPQIIKIDLKIFFLYAKVIYIIFVL